MFDRKALKAKAKEYAFSHLWPVWKGFLLMGVVTMAVSMVSSVLGGIFVTNIKGTMGTILYVIVTLVAELGVLPLQIGLYAYVLGLVRKKDPDLVECLFKYYKDGSYLHIIKHMVIVCVIYALLSLLLVIPGIIYLFMMIQVPYILADLESKKIEDTNVREMSKKMMDGHKWEYFVLQLSFILWLIGCSFTLGILCIWVVPYMTVTNTMYYDYLKELSK